jgi:hypothetical protein
VDTGTLIGLVMGLVGVALGLGVPIAMWRGVISRWLAIRPEAGARGACDPETLRTRLLALNSADQPFRYVPAADGGVVAEWRIADATWQQFFARFHATEDYRATLAFSAEHREVRVLEQRSSTRSGPGEASASRFQGIDLFERSRHREWALTGRLPVVPRDALSFDFDVRRIKGPLIDTTLACGWTWVPVVLRSHLTAQRRLA